MPRGLYLDWSGGRMEITILRKRFFDTAVADVLRALNGQALVGAMTLSLCVLDYLVYLRDAPTEKLGQHYKCLVEDFLEKRVDARYIPERMWGLRCALVHTYAQSIAMKNTGLQGYALTHLNRGFHLTESGNVLCLNIDSFVTDVVWTTQLFFDDPSSCKNAEKNSDDLLVVKILDREADKPYGKMHWALRELDKDSPRRDVLYTDVSAILQPDPQLRVNVSTLADSTGTSGRWPTPK
jgi:hypothetical protein